MRSGLWWTLPLAARLAVCSALLVMSIAPPFGTVASVVIWASAGLALLWSGAFSFGRVQAVYLVLTLSTLVYVLAFSVFFGRPVSELFLFVGHYPKFIYFLLAAAVVTAGVSLPEWLWVLRPLPWIGAALTSLVLSVTTAINSISYAFNRAMEAARVARVSTWHGAPVTRVTLWQRAEVMLVMTVEMSGLLTDSILSWVPKAVDTDNPSTTIRLDQIYDLPSFPAIYDSKFGGAAIDPQWLAELQIHCLPGLAVLEIGAGNGRLSNTLASWGCNVKAVEPNPHFAKSLESAYPHVPLVRGKFPGSNGHAYNVIVLHQNVFLELINQRPLTSIWQALRASLAPGGVVLFDYPDITTPPVLHEQRALLDEHIDGVGHVTYSYTPIFCDEAAMDVAIELAVKSEVAESAHTLTLRCCYSPLDLLRASSLEQSLKWERDLDLDLFSFFPGQMKLCVARAV